MKKELLTLLVSLTACAPGEDVNKNTEESVVAWGELSGIWQSYEGDQTQSHNNWFFIRDYGDYLDISTCYSPTSTSFPRDRIGNLIYDAQVPVGHVLSDSEIVRTETISNYTPGGYHKIESSDFFKTGSLSLDIVSDETGRHWSAIDDSTLCTQLTYSLYGDTMEIEIYTPNTITTINLPGNSYTGSFTVENGVYMNFDSRIERTSLFVHNGTIDCNLTTEEDLNCSIDISGFSVEGPTSAHGELTIYKQYLTLQNAVIN